MQWKVAHAHTHGPIVPFPEPPAPADQPSASGVQKELFSQRPPSYEESLNTLLNSRPTAKLPEKYLW